MYVAFSYALAKISTFPCELAAYELLEDEDEGLLLLILVPFVCSYGLVYYGLRLSTKQGERRKNA